jgi:nucleoside-diphosphate-sugar epimerase
MRRFMEMVWDCLDYGQVQSNDEEIQRPPFVIPVPLAYGIIWCLSLLAKLLRIPSWITTDELGNGVSVRYFDNSLARDVLGYIPENKLEDSIGAACRTYKARQRD